jgi:hypothetical protein
LYQEILKLETELEGLRSCIEDKLLASLNSGVQGFGYDDFWCEQVRQRVREGK